MSFMISVPGANPISLLLNAVTSYSLLQVYTFINLSVVLKWSSLRKKVFIFNFLRNFLIGLPRALMWSFGSNRDRGQSSKDVYTCSNRFLVKSKFVPRLSVFFKFTKLQFWRKDLKIIGLLF
jgi:hypothetical protein